MILFCQRQSDKLVACWLRPFRRRPDPADPTRRSARRRPSRVCQRRSDNRSAHRSRPFVVARSRHPGPPERAPSTMILFASVTATTVRAQRPGLVAQTLAPGLPRAPRSTRILFASVTAIRCRPTVPRLLVVAQTLAPGLPRAPGRPGSCCQRRSDNRRRAVDAPRCRSDAGTADSPERPGRSGSCLRASQRYVVGPPFPGSSLSLRRWHPDSPERPVDPDHVCQRHSVNGRRAIDAPRCRSDAGTAAPHRAERPARQPSPPRTPPPVESSSTKQRRAGGFMPPNRRESTIWCRITTPSLREIIRAAKSSWPKVVSRR